MTFDFLTQLLKLHKMIENKESQKKNANGMHIPKMEHVGNKSKLYAYILWLFGGIFGLHHFYLDRDDQALVWLSSGGGYFGCGWLRDLFKIPWYVAEANNDSRFLHWFKGEVRKHQKPPFTTMRFLGQFMISCLWGNFVFIAIPEDEINGINFKPLYILIPFAIALGTWVVGNIGKEKGSIWMALIASYICYPTLYFIGDSTMWMALMALMSALAFDTFSKQWRFTPKKRNTTTARLLYSFLTIIICCSLLTSYFYFNATITDNEGEEIKLSEAIKHFFTSPIWTDVKASVEQLWTYARHQGFWAVWKELIDLSDPRGEINAYRVLGLSQTASQSEVTSKWRALSREHHPDKVKGTEEERRQAQEKFMEIQQAYEILSRAKNRRQSRNRKPS